MSHRVDDVLDVGADLGVVVAFGRIIKPHVLDAVPMVNLHFSLLPRWRGAAPVERAILAGDAVTGVCLMDVEEGLDTGGVRAETELEIGPDETADELRARLVEAGTEPAAPRPAHRACTRPTPQEGEATYAAKIEPDELRLDWDAPGRRAAPGGPGGRGLDHVPGQAAEGLAQPRVDDGLRRRRSRRRRRRAPRARSYGDGVATGDGRARAGRGAARGQGPHGRRRWRRGLQPAPAPTSRLGA